MKNKFFKLSSLLFVCTLLYFNGIGAIQKVKAVSGDVLWAKTTTYEPMAAP